MRSSPSMGVIERTASKPRSHVPSHTNKHVMLTNAEHAQYGSEYLGIYCNLIFETFIHFFQIFQKNGKYELLNIPGKANNFPNYEKYFEILYI